MLPRLARCKAGLTRTRKEPQSRSRRPLPRSLARRSLRRQRQSHRPRPIRALPPRCCPIQSRQRRKHRPARPRRKNMQLGQRRLRPLGIRAHRMAGGARMAGSALHRGQFNRASLRQVSRPSRGQVSRPGLRHVSWPSRGLVDRPSRCHLCAVSQARGVAAAQSLGSRLLSPFSSSAAVLTCTCTSRVRLRPPITTTMHRARLPRCPNMS